MQNPSNPLRHALPWIFLATAVAFNLFAYAGELTLRAPDLNDHVLHFGAISRANDVWQSGGNPRDPWISYWSQGFPLLRYYQHLSHLGVVFTFRALRGAVPLYDVFQAINFALIVLTPLSFFLGARLLGFGRLAAGFVALCLPLLGASTGEKYSLGFQTQAYLWSGPGMFPQLAGMALFAPAIGAVQRAVLTRQRYGLALFLLAGLWLCHILLGYMACALGGLALFRPEARHQRTRVALGLASLYTGTFAVCAYLILPSLFESHLLHRSVSESAEYWDSFGIGRIVPWLLRGDLLDGTRFPVLTALCLGGLGISFTRSSERVATLGAIRLGVLAFALSLLIYFGRPTWGSLLVLMPFSGDFPLHRWLCALQFAALLLSGLSLAWIWERLRWDTSRLRLAVSAALTLALLGPAYAARWEASRPNQEMQERAATDYQSGGRGIHEVLREIRQLDGQDPGRGYAGRGWDWGTEYRLGFTPVYMFWSGADISAIAYMFQMSLNTDMEAKFDRSRQDHHDLFNVRYLLHYDAAQLPSFAEVVATRPGIYSARVSTPGYFDVVGADLVYPASYSNPDAVQELAREFIAGDLHARGRFVRVTFGEDDSSSVGRVLASPADLEQVAAEPWQRPLGKIHRSWGRNDWFSAHVAADERAHVLFRMSYHPDWRATVDGVAVKTVMLTPSFIGIPIDPGEHLVELRYLPGRWTTWLFYAGLALLGLGLLGDRFDAWSHPRDLWTKRRRILLEGAALLGIFALLQLLVNLPLPEDRMPHSEAAHANKIEYFRSLP